MPQQDNPYATPNTPVNDIYDNDGSFGDIKIFTAKGRMGRLRYLMYGMLVGIVGMILIGIAATLGNFVHPYVGIGLGIIGYIAMFVISIFLTIQRCHDFNTTGWLALLLLVPIAPLVFYFIPGTKGANQYGSQPPPNSTGVKVAAFLLLAIFIIGMIAAIALPQFAPQGSLDQLNSIEQTLEAMPTE